MPDERKKIFLILFVTCGLRDGDTFDQYIFPVILLKSYRYTKANTAFSSIEEGQKFFG